jgi:hypothetical protein
MITAELWDRDAQRTHGQAHGRRSSGGHYAFLWGSEAHDLNTASKHRREAALGYDHEAVSYGIGDAQRTHGQGTRTPRSGGHYAFLWEKQAHDTNTASKPTAERQH